jgi:pimeloyl-ACP methyl ester carboxylesterase
VSAPVFERWAHASPVAGVTLRGWCTPPTGRPLLHMLHGNGFCGRVYEPMLTALSADFDLWLCDLPGHGDSDPMPGAPDWNLFAQTALECALNATTRYGSVPRLALGHSLGGVLTTLMLAAPQQPFERAVLLDPVLFPPAMLLAMRLGLGRLNPLARASRRRRREWPSRAEAALKLHGRGTYQGWAHEAMQAFVTHALRDTAHGSVTLKCAPELEADIFASCPHGLWPAVKRVRAPTLILHGRDTMPFVHRGAQRARTLNPAAFSEQLVEGGHCFMQQHPADAAAAARAHLLG